MPFLDLAEALSETGYGTPWSHAIEWQFKDLARRAAKRLVKVDKRKRSYQVESRHAKKNTCPHPDRPHKARGLCNTCHLVEWRKAKKAS